jgi:hypothetical protein
MERLHGLSSKWYNSFHAKEYRKVSVIACNVWVRNVVKYGEYSSAN